MRLFAVAGRGIAAGRARRLARAGERGSSWLGSISARVTTTTTAICIKHRTARVHSTAPTGTRRESRTEFTQYALRSTAQSWGSCGSADYHSCISSPAYTHIRIRRPDEIETDDATLVRSSALQPHTGHTVVRGLAVAFFQLLGRARSEMVGGRAGARARAPLHGPISTAAYTRFTCMPPSKRHSNRSKRASPYSRSRRPQKERACLRDAAEDLLIDL